MSKNRSPRGRRDFLKGSLAASAALAACGTDDAASSSPRNRVVEENEKEGSLDWQLTRVRLDKRDGYRSPAIEGYCSHQSIEAGETLRLMVSTNPAQKYQVEIFRMGYYGGRGARLMTTLGPFDGATQPDPDVQDLRLRECRWEASAELKIPEDWLSGVYLGRLTLLTGSDELSAWQSYVVFIVRDRRKADVLFQCSDNTWQAYNRWPDDYSLYTHPDGSLVSNVEVSFDRPYCKYAQIYENPQSVGSGEFLCWEYPLCYWLESRGYDVTYCSNSDMIDPAQPLRARAFVSVGHDEYWDLRQSKARWQRSARV